MNWKHSALAAVSVAAWVLGVAPAHAGFDEGLAAYGAQDYAAAYKEWQPLADQGNREAQFRLGELYLNAQGVLFDVAQAVSWYEKAAAQGQAAAQAKLGMLYAEGKLVPADRARSIKWYVAAAGSGDTTAQINLAVIYADGKGSEQEATRALERAQAFHWMEQAAKSGNAIAQYNLGLWYMQGKTVEPDPERARYWYLQSATQGNDGAQYNLAFALREGRGGPVEAAGALAWMRKAAEHGYVTAQTALGSMYAMGDGVLRDYGQAIYWYQKASDAGDAKAQAFLGLMYRQGNGVPKDDALAARYYQLAANQGMAEIQSILGGMYYAGSGVKQDYTKAMKWYKKAADQGDLGAFVGLGAMYENGAGVPRDEVQAEAWYRKAAEGGYRNGRDHLAALKEKQQAAVAGGNKPVDARARLFALVRVGNLPEVARIFAGGGTDVDMVLDDGMTLLDAAIEAHHADVAQFLLEHGADVNRANSLDATPIQFAAYYGMAELIPLLARHGADLNHQVKEGKQTALFIAAERGELESTQALLDAGADPNIPNVQDVLPLAFAISGNHKEIARLLLEHGTRVDQSDERGEDFLSQAAAQPGWSDIVGIILSRGAKCGLTRNNSTELDGAADIEIVHILEQCIERSTGHVPPLNVTLANAARNGRSKLVSDLIDAGAAVNGAPAGRGDVPLVMAMQASNALEVVQVLIEKGADPNRLDADGNAALHELGWQFKSDMVPLVNFLLKHGADVNLHAQAARSELGNTPLHFAVIGGHREYVQALLEYGAQVDVPGEGDKTPLAVAIDHGRTDMATLLLEHGADIDAKGHDTFSPLWLAVMRGQSRLVRYVLEHGADVNYRGMKNNFPSHTLPLAEAAQAGRTGIVALLLAHGADPGLGRHDRLDSPLWTAVFYGQYDIVRAFFEKKPSLSKEFDLIELASQTRDEELRAYLFSKAGIHDKPAKFVVLRRPESDERDGEIDPVWNALQEPGLSSFKHLLESARHGKELAYWDTEAGHACLLLVATFKGRADVVRYLLEKGVPPDRTLVEVSVPDELRKGELQQQLDLMKAVYGTSGTPLLVAVKGGNEEIALALLGHGANPNLKFHAGLDISALAGSANTPANVSMSEILLAHGALPGALEPFSFDELIRRQEQEEIRLLFDFGLDRNDVGHHDGEAMQASELNRANADAVHMIAASRPEQWKATCRKMLAKDLSEACLPGELRDADHAVQDGFTRALEQASRGSLAAVKLRQANWESSLQKSCHVGPRRDVPDGWYAAILDQRTVAVCVVEMMRRQEQAMLPKP